MELAAELDLSATLPPVQFSEMQRKPHLHVGPVSSQSLPKHQLSCTFLLPISRLQVFCWLAGEGYSSRAEDSNLNGCNPVLLTDEVEPVFSSVLVWLAFSIRVKEV